MSETAVERRLREMAEGLVNGAPECWNGDDARAQVGWAQDLTVAADTLRDALKLLREWNEHDLPSSAWVERHAALLARCEGEAR